VAFATRGEVSLSVSYWSTLPAQPPSHVSRAAQRALRTDDCFVSLSRRSSSLVSGKSVARPDSRLGIVELIERFGQRRVGSMQAAV
jgi:hypothetical protein